MLDRNHFSPLGHLSESILRYFPSTLRCCVTLSLFQVRGNLSLRTSSCPVPGCGSLFLWRSLDGFVSSPVFIRDAEAVGSFGPVPPSPDVEWQLTTEIWRRKEDCRLFWVLFVSLQPCQQGCTYSLCNSRHRTGDLLIIALFSTLAGVAWSSLSGLCPLFEHARILSQDMLQPLVMWIFSFLGLPTAEAMIWVIAAIYLGKQECRKYLLSLACGVYFGGLSLCFGKQRPGVLGGTLCRHPCHPPLLPLLLFYFCHGFQAEHTRTTHSTTGAALCIGTFSVPLLIMSCCLAGDHRTPCSRCWRSALSVSSIAFLNANV